MCKSGNWLHFQCVGTQWVEGAIAAVDTKMFTKLAVLPKFCQNAVKVTGISMHSYRYTLAERARRWDAQRFAQQVLGHSSKAFARAYSKKGKGYHPLIRRLRTENCSDASGRKSITIFMISYTNSPNPPSR